jgi:restriction endonuclease Mrr
MTDFSLWQLILLVVGGIGGVKGALDLFNFVAARYDLAKKNRKELKATHDSLAIENRRLDLDENEHNRAEWLQIIESLKERITDLKAELAEIENYESLSRTVLNNIYAAFRAHRRAVEKLDLKIMKHSECDDLKEPLENLKATLDELEKQLPS